MRRRTTTYDEVEQHFTSRSPHARRLIEDWSTRQLRAVVDFVQQHEVSALYDVTTADVEEAAARTEHALGRVRRDEAESVPEIVDWTTPWAFAHVLHAQLETERRVPTYQEFRR